MELSNQLPGSHPLTAPVHPPERVTGPPELHHSEGRYLSRCERQSRSCTLLRFGSAAEATTLAVGSTAAIRLQQALAVQP